MCDQKNNAEGDGGEAIGGANPQQGGENAAQENAGAIDDPGGMKISRDQSAHRRSQGGAHKTLPGDSPGIHGGEDHDDGGNGSPIKLREFEAL